MLATARLHSSSSPAAARTSGLGFIQFSVQDLDGEFIPIGEVEFCLNGDDDSCFYADIDRGFPYAIPPDNGFAEDREAPLADVAQQLDAASEDGIPGRSLFRGR